ncbi:MAG: SdiA-regulated domain-containing protein [Chitinophagaceae bacterium]|nr:SdiA-regulated domain-containing protein [Chitinophagaceae bacterium]
MLVKNLSFPAIALLILFGTQSCESKKSKTLATPSQYDLNNPVEFKLPEGLNEISGLAYYPKDSSVFAIIDEDGILFKIYLNGSGTIKKWKFDKKHDFEDIVMHDSTFYVLISNGDIETLKFAGDSILKNKSNLAGAGKKTNEFESLYFDDKSGLILLCKDCEDDKKKTVTAWGYSSADSLSYNPNLFAIEVKQIAQKIKEEKLHFKPSSAAINPKTNELYIISSVNKLLVIAERNGNIKEVYPLDPVIYKQPEGITFTPSGDLLISNEAAESGNANILIFKQKK